MSLVMTGEEFHEAYGDAGMDEQDMRAWALAVERACEHDDAPAAAEALGGRTEIYCPTCGESVHVPTLLEGWELEAEMRAEMAVGA